MGNASEDCTHPSVYGTLCVLCGSEVSNNNEKDDNYHTILHDNAHLKMNKSHRELDASLQSKELVKSRQLVCILDLDQTILHCLIGKVTGKDEILSFYLHNCLYNIYFRKHLRQLLDTLKSDYMTHIYTMGTNEYCEQIKNYMSAKMMFDVNSRWMGRDLNILPGEQAHMKSINRFNCPLEYTIVLDDRIEVWKQIDNVVPILPYYHSLVGDINGSDRFKLFQNVVFKMDNHLVYVDRLLKLVHQEFYKIKHANLEVNDVPRILKECLSIFKDCYFVLTGFIPTSSNKDLFIPILNLIEKYGGVVSDEVTDKTTHCICIYMEESAIIDEKQFLDDVETSVPLTPNDDTQIDEFLKSKASLTIKTTDKVKQAKNRCFLLPPEWIYLSCYSYCRLSEERYNYLGMLPSCDPVLRSRKVAMVLESKESLVPQTGRNRAKSTSTMSSSDLESLANDLENDYE
eukprot:NODE_159_length_16647_cov_0.251390.p3 type:complete len:458 gc:universal NODE_159_length_16647_cov_0.251390:1493-2866(+)